MSLNAIPIRLLPSIDPVLDFAHEREFTVYNGGQEISYTPFPAQATNNSNIQVTCNPPDENTVIDPQIYVGIDYELLFTGVGAGGGPLLQPGVYDGVRSFPISNTVNTVDLKMNGTSFNTNLNEYFSGIIRTGNYQEEQNLAFSLTPDMLDYFQEYGQGVGSPRNPLNNYNDSQAYLQSRGAFLDPSVGGVNYITNSNTAAEVNFTAVERVYLSPFYPSKNGFAGVKTMTITFTFSDLRRIWSHASNVLFPLSGNITNLVVNITGLTMYFRYITPKLLEHIPKRICWPYHEFLISATTRQTAIPAKNPLLAPTPVIVNMSAINLEATPKRLLVYAREQDTDLLSGNLAGNQNFTKSDVFAGITSISINYGNNQGKLSSATPYDLYTIARRNGCNMSWIEWSQQVGSVLPIDIGKDIGLDPLHAPGQLSNPLLSMNVGIVNLNPLRSITFTLFVFIIYEGTACINHGSVTKSIAVLNSQDVLNSQKGDSPVLISHEPTNFYGGDFFSGLKKTLGNVNKYLKKSKLISTVANAIPHPYARAVGSIAKNVGYGMRAGLRAGSVVEMPPHYYDLEEGKATTGGRKRKSKKGGKRKKSSQKKLSRAMMMKRGGNLANEDSGSDDNDDIYNESDNFDQLPVDHGCNNNDNCDINEFDNEIQI